MTAPKRPGRAPKRGVKRTAFAKSDSFGGKKIRQQIAYEDTLTAEQTMLKNLLVQIRQQAGTLDRLEAKLDALIKATTALPLVKNKRGRK